MIEITRVDYVRVPVDDIEAAKHFYGEVLGPVPDVAAAKDKLEAAGVEVGEMWDSGVCNGAGLNDPAGNRILLHHRYKPYDQS